METTKKQNALTLAREIARPTRDAILQRAPSVHHFWNNNTSLFEDAWTEWEDSADLSGLALDDSLYAPALRDAVNAAWDNPTDDSAARDLWEEVFPGVYKA